MGGGIAGLFGRWIKLNQQDCGFYSCGIAAGFAAVFLNPSYRNCFCHGSHSPHQYDALSTRLIASLVAKIYWQ
jgi:hypothetical protein